jgi:1-deoxy-D-xylulose-5-phosphate synthase
MAAGMAAGGLRPVVAIYSTFMQRAFDQVHHDVALCGQPVVFAVDRAGAVPEDGETHQGIYDIQAFRAVPGLAMLAPAGAGELMAALRWAMSRNGPSMIRFPKAVCPPEPVALETPFVEGQGVLISAAVKDLSGQGKAGQGKAVQGKAVQEKAVQEKAGAEETGKDDSQARYSPGSLILFMVSGALVDEALQAAGLAARAGISADVYHLRFLKPVDHDFLSVLAGRYKAVVVAEEGVLTGSVAVDIMGSIRAGHPGLSVRALGFEELPLSHMGRAALLGIAGLDACGLYRAAEELLG